MFEKHRIVLTAGFMYYLVGYNLMYDDVDGGYLGSFSIFDGF